MTKKSNLIFFEKKLNVLTTFVQNKILNVNNANIINAFSFFSIVEISKKFQKRIKNDYQKKFIWIKIQNYITKIVKNDIKTIFYEKNNLLYFKKKTYLQHVFLFRCLCLFQSILKKIFKQFIAIFIWNFINIMNCFFQFII